MASTPSLERLTDPTQQPASAPRFRHKAPICAHARPNGRSCDLRRHRVHHTFASIHPMKTMPSNGFDAEITQRDSSAAAVGGTTRGGTGPVRAPPSVDRRGLRRARLRGEYRGAGARRDAPARRPRRRRSGATDMHLHRLWFAVVALVGVWPPCCRASPGTPRRASARAGRHRRSDRDPLRRPPSRPTPPAGHPPDPLRGGLRNGSRGAVPSAGGGQLVGEELECRLGLRLLFAGEVDAVAA